MKILIVDDKRRSAKRIRGNLAADKDMKFLEISDPQLAMSLIDFGVRVDVALVDLRYVNSANSAGDEDGFAVCQYIRNALPSTVIVGYSSGFSLESEENKKLRETFRSMGADIVYAFHDLSQKPVSELRYAFNTAIAIRSGSLLPGRRPKVFIGSSKEGLEIARRIQAELINDFEVVIWDQTVFGLSVITIQGLEQAIRDFQFAVFVFTPDDKVQSRNESFSIPRDNVVFEAGLFIGSLGRSRTFVVRGAGNGIRLPSDFAGLTVAMFDQNSSNLAAALGPACQQIRDAVKTVLAADPNS